jgi:hypothetical protein
MPGARRGILRQQRMLWYQKPLFLPRAGFDRHLELRGFVFSDTVSTVPPIRMPRLEDIIAASGCDVNWGTEISPERGGGQID